MVFTGFRQISEVGAGAINNEGWSICFVTVSLGNAKDIRRK